MISVPLKTNGVDDWRVWSLPSLLQIGFACPYRGAEDDARVLSKIGRSPATIVLRGRARLRVMNTHWRAIYSTNVTDS